MDEEKIDKTDMKLLYELDQNCRQSLSSVAKKLRISRNRALYRLNRLKEKGIIKGTFTEINVLAMGYYSFRFFIRLGNCSKAAENRLIKFILSTRKLMWFFKVLGNWNLDIVYATKDIFEFEAFRKELMLRFNKIIAGTHTSILTQIYHYPKDYLIGRARRPGKRKILNPNMKPSLDEKDELLLRLLADKADTSILELAKKAGLSINTVKKRLRDMEKSDIILGYRLFIDTNKLGYNYYKLHLNLKNYAEDDVMRFRAFLESKNFVTYTDHYIQGEDYEIEMHLKGEKEYLAFLDELKENFGRIIGNQFVIKFYEELVYKYLPETA